MKEALRMMGLRVSDADGIHRPHSSALPLTRGSEPSRPTAGSGLWTVFHSDGDEAGLMSRKFATEAEARAATKRWNKTYPGHIVIPPNAPDEGRCIASPPAGCSACEWSARQTQERQTP